MTADHTEYRPARPHKTFHLPKALRIALWAIIGTVLIVLFLLYFAFPAYNSYARQKALDKAKQGTSNGSTAPRPNPVTRSIASTRPPEVFMDSMDILEYPNADDPDTLTVSFEPFLKASQSVIQIVDGKKKHPGWNVDGVALRYLRVMQDAKMDKPAKVEYSRVIRKLKAYGYQPPKYFAGGIPVLLTEGK